MRAAAGSAHETEQAEREQQARAAKELAEAETLPPVKRLDPSAAWPFPAAKPNDFEVINQE
jgi:hypothetical protein